jgi:uncharacterized YigZ family protein
MKIFEKDNIENNLEINKSKFICIVKKINSKEDFDIFIENVKKKYPKATHYVPVYRFIDNGKIVYYFSDDGEPSKTAGFPVYNIIEKNDIINIGVCIVRYFGGIKLGTGGLVKAYSKVFLDILQNNKLKEFKVYKKYEIIIDIKLINVVNYFLNKNEIKILEKYFGEDVIYKIEVNEKDENLLLNFIKNNEIEIIKN